MFSRLSWFFSSKSHCNKNRNGGSAGGHCRLQRRCYQFARGRFGTQQSYFSSTPSTSVVLAVAAGALASFLLVSKQMKVSAATTASGSVSLDEEEIDFQKNTHFTLDDLHKRVQHFKTKYPSGMTLDDFARLTGIKDLTHASMIFHAIDTDHNGIVDWKEWLLYASIISSGIVEEKLNFQFNVYDLDEDGSISFHDLVSILKMHIKTGSISQSTLLHHEHYWQTGKRSPEQLALELMEKCSLRHDLRISRSEFSSLSQEVLKLVNYHTHIPKIPTLHFDKDLTDFNKSLK